MKEKKEEEERRSRRGRGVKPRRGDSNMTDNASKTTNFPS